MYFVYIKLRITCSYYTHWAPMNFDVIHIWYKGYLGQKWTGFRRCSTSHINLRKNMSSLGPDTLHVKHFEAITRKLSELRRYSLNALDHLASHRTGVGHRFYVGKFGQLLVVGRWFPPGAPVSFTNETDISSAYCLDLTLAVAEALSPNKHQFILTQYSSWVCSV